MRKRIMKAVALVLVLCFVLGLMPHTEAKADENNNYTLSVQVYYDANRKSAIPSVVCDDPAVCKYAITLCHYVNDGKGSPYKPISFKEATQANPYVEFSASNFLTGGGQENDKFVLIVSAHDAEDTNLYSKASEIFTVNIEALADPEVLMDANGYVLLKNIDSRSSKLYIDLIARNTVTGVEKTVKSDSKTNPKTTDSFYWDAGNFKNNNSEDMEFYSKVYLTSDSYRKSNNVSSNAVTYDPNCIGILEGKTEIKNVTYPSDTAICVGDTIRADYSFTIGNDKPAYKYQLTYFWQSSTDGIYWAYIPSARAADSITVQQEHLGKYIRCTITADDFTGELITAPKMVVEPKVYTINFLGYGEIQTRRDGTIDIKNWPVKTYPGYCIYRWEKASGISGSYLSPSSTHEFTEDMSLRPEIKMQGGVDGFVARLYQVCFGRYPDEGGFNTWKDGLIDQINTGVKTAYGFIFSPEFRNKNLCNDHYVEYLYMAVMGRTFDKDGKDYWIEKLETGTNREAVFNGFLKSTEFKNLCTEYGIVQGTSITVPKYGTIPKGPCSVCGEKDGVTQFVERLYYKALGRTTIDLTGLDNWCNQLWSRKIGGSAAAKGFFFSKEFTNKNLSNEEYVTLLYQVLMGRDPDQGGFDSWVAQLKSGKTRLQVFNGFAGSKEWDSICKKYGILK